MHTYMYEQQLTGKVDLSSDDSLSSEIYLDMTVRQAISIPVGL